MYSSTVSSTSVLDGGWVVNATARKLYPWEKPGTKCIGGWVEPRTCLEGCGKFRVTGIRFPNLPTRSESLYRLSYTGVDGMVILRWIFQDVGCGGMEWIELAEERDRWRALVNAVMNLLVV